MVSVVVVVVAIAGYMLGTKKGKEASTEKSYGTTSQQPARSPSANRPVDYDEVLEQLLGKLGESPDDWTLEAQVGDTYFGLRRFAEAIPHFEKAIELNPEDANLYNNLALSRHYTGNPIEGLKIIEEGLKRDPYYQRVWLTKGFLLAYGLGNPEEAAKAWEKAVALDPTTQVGKAAADYLKEYKNN